jgi:hypothetical protein
MEPPKYSQGGNSPWADNFYAGSDKKISALGCALSCMAIAMTAFGDTINPGELNEWMKHRSKYDGGFDNLDITWDPIALHSPGKRLTRTPAKNASESFDARILDSNLLKCDLIIAKVFNFESVKHKPEEVQQKKRKEGNHWVLITGTTGNAYSIIDPGRGLTNLSDYGRVYRYLIVSKN